MRLLIVSRAIETAAYTIHTCRNISFSIWTGLNVQYTRTHSDMKKHARDLNNVTALKAYFIHYEFRILCNKKHIIPTSTSSSNHNNNNNDNSDRSSGTHTHTRPRIHSNRIRKKYFLAAMCWLLCILSALIFTLTLVFMRIIIIIIVVHTPNRRNGVFLSELYHNSLFFFFFE